MDFRNAKDVSHRVMIGIDLHSVRARSRIAINRVEVVVVLDYNFVIEVRTTRHWHIYVLFRSERSKSGRNVSRICLVM